MNGQGHVHDLLGAYALDALDEDEAARVRAHFAHCPTCRAQFSELAERLQELLAEAGPALAQEGVRTERLAVAAQLIGRPSAAVSDPVSMKSTPRAG